MQILSDPLQFSRPLQGGVLCIGNFDGVHLGHAQMLSTGREQAKTRGIPFTIMTFDPHPALLLKPDTQRLPLLTRQQRLDLLATFSPDVLVVIPTSKAFLGISADDFIRDIVAGERGIAATLLVEGPTFTYGRGAKGTVQTLQQSTQFQTIIVPTVEQSLTDLSLVKVSSTLIRWLVNNGRVTDAARALGRPYTLRGIVVEGQKRGRTIGFPTANLQSQQLLPAAGIYAGKATVPSMKQSFRAAISVGNNPTFQNSPSTVEAFLLDFPPADLYGQTVDLAFERWLREMFTFSGTRPLVTQITRDVEETRNLIKEPA